MGLKFLGFRRFGGYNRGIFVRIAKWSLNDFIGSFWERSYGEWRDKYFADKVSFVFFCFVGNFLGVFLVWVFFSGRGDVEWEFCR